MIDLIKDIDYKNLIQNLSGIGSFITSLITLFTLIVLIKQRKDSFRPRVIFGDRLYAVCKPEKDNILKTIWEDAYPKKKEKIIDFCFELLNVGVGVAENVTVKEVFDYKKAIKFIEQYDKKNEFIFEESDGTLDLRTTFDESFMITVLDKIPRELGTFLVGKQDKPNKYIFTDSCLMFLSCFDYLRKNNKSLSLDKFPRCNYEIEYSDIEGKNYKVKYECKISSVLFDSYTFEFIKK